MIIRIERMADLEPGTKLRLRELSEGPIAWGLHNLTLHDGSTWAALYLVGDEVLSWAALTLEYDFEPMIGAYTPEEHRGKGYAAQAVVALLRSKIADGVLTPGSAINASTWRWPHYTELIESVGLIAQPWS